MRVGISVLTHAGQNIWENGMGQNVLFLAQLLQRIEFVESVTLVDAGDQPHMPPQVDLAARGLALARARELTDALDVVIEMAGALDVQWLSYFRACGGRVRDRERRTVDEGVARGAAADHPRTDEDHDEQDDRYDDQGRPTQPSARIRHASTPSSTFYAGSGRLDDQLGPMISPGLQRACPIPAG